MRIWLLRGLSFPVLLFCLAVFLFSQASTPEKSGDATFKAKARLVVLDVVVTDHDNKPVPGLTVEDFEILEAGKPQTIASFEEHAPTPPAQPLALPANTFTNFQQTKPSESVNVLVLDSLNTPIADQAKMRPEMISCLSSIQPGTHVAIFSLGSDLRMLQGFTSDSSVLLASLNSKKLGSRPLASPQLDMSANNLDMQFNNQLAMSSPAVPNTETSVKVLQQMKDQTSNFQAEYRAKMTLTAMQELAKYLEGFPGRKNLIWLSGSFPMGIIPGRGVQNYEWSLTDQVLLRKTVNMLAAAQVAIYPIATEGLSQEFFIDTSHVKSMSHQTTEEDPSRQTGMNWDDGQMPHRNEVNNANQSTMYELANDTGGEAFYNANGMKQAFAQVIRDGVEYYTISYIPSDSKADGRFIPIEIKVPKGKYKLAYRHGYYADEKGSSAGTAQPARDPLRPLMISGIPNATQIIYKVRVLPMPPKAASVPTSDVGKAAKTETVRYSVEFAILLHDLSFQLMPTGERTARVEIALVAYDADGLPVSNIVTSGKIPLDEQHYTAAETTGVQLSEEIEVPKRDLTLRTGVYDLASGNAGTLEFPLHGNSAEAFSKK